MSPVSSDGRPVADRTIYSSAWVLALLFALTVIGLSILIFRFSHQPLWHPDEPGKIVQLRTGYRNFFHPQLMMTVTSLIDDIANWLGVDENIARAGRLGSALAASFAAVILAVTAARGFGLPSTALALLICASNPAIILSGHYFKEDSYLHLGLAFLIAAVDAIARQGLTRRTALGLGAAGAFICSAKYVGVLPFMIAIVLLPVLLRNWATEPAQLSGKAAIAFGLLPFCLLLAAINYPAILRPGEFWSGLETEIHHVTTSHGGIAQPWSLDYLFLLIDLNGWVEIGLVVVGVVLMRFGSVESNRIVALKISCAIIVVYGLAILWSPVQGPRYGYPLAILLSFIASVVVATALHTDRFAIKAGGVAAAVLAVAHHGLVTQEVAIQQGGTRMQLSRWLQQNSRRGDLIVTDFYAGLASENLDGTMFHTYNVAVKTEIFAADRCLSGGCATARYVVVASTSFARFMRDNVTMDSDNQRRRDYYRALLAKTPVASFCSEISDLSAEFGSFDDPCIHVFTGAQAAPPRLSRDGAR